MHSPDVADLLQGRWPGHFICAEGPLPRGTPDTGTDRRAGTVIGPEFDTVSRSDLVASARAAADADYDVLVAARCATRRTPLGSASSAASPSSGRA